MTRKEFIGVYNVGYRDGKVEDYCPNDYDDIFDIGQEPNIDMESEEIKTLQKRAYLEGFHEALKMSVKQESCEDCIERNKEFFKKWVNYKMLDKIRAEILNKAYRNFDEHINDYTDEVIDLDDALEIIDKYRMGDKE